MNDNTFTPPHSVQAEQSLIGGLLVDNKSFDRIGDFLTEEDFFRADHKLVFRAIYELAISNRPFDAVTVAEWLEKHSLLEDAGGMTYIGVLAKASPGSTNIKAYAEIVREHAIVRRVIQHSIDTIDEARGAVVDVNELLENAQRRFTDIGRPIGGGPEKLMSRYARWVEQVDHQANSGTNLVGASTGFRALDDAIGGLERGNFYIIAGRPSMGKTVNALNIAEAFAKRGEVAAVWELEMPHEQLITRSVASNAEIDGNKVRRAEMSKEEWERLHEVTHKMGAWPLFIDDQAGLSMMEIRTRARRLKRQQGRLDLIVIDYLQLVKAPGENQTARITAVSQDMKTLAKELDVPVIALSQLNRGLEQRHNKRPIASDLRDSGSIEQDADVIIFLYREAVYDPDFLYDDVAEMIINKQRNGAPGTVYLKFTPAQFRFSGLPPETQRDYLLHFKGGGKSKAPKNEAGFID